MSFTPQVTMMEVLTQGANTFPRVPKYVCRIALAAGTEQHFDLKTLTGLSTYQALFMIFSSDAPFYASYYNTATLPSGSNTVDGSAPEYNPNQRYIPPDVTSLSLISPGAANITIDIFKP